MPFDKATVKPGSGAQVLGSASERNRKESAKRFAEQMEPWLSAVERPYLELASEPSHFASGCEVGELRCRCRHTARHFVSAET